MSTEINATDAQENNKHAFNESLGEIAAQLAPCPSCAGTDIYWSDCAGKFLVHPAGGGGPAYGRLVCRDCGLGTTPCPTDRKENAAAQWNVRLESRLHSSDYWKAVRSAEANLLSSKGNEP